jgi:hypothetical protein
VRNIHERLKPFYGDICEQKRYCSLHKSSKDIEKLIFMVLQGMHAFASPWRNPVTTSWCVIGLQMEETASRYEGLLRIYGISSCEQPIRGASPAQSWARGSLLLTAKKKLVIKYYTGPRNWTILWIEELHNLHTPPNISRVIKSRMRWTGHVTRTEGEMHVKY